MSGWLHCLFLCLRVFGAFAANAGLKVWEGCLMRARSDMQGVELNNAGEESHLMIETSGHGAMKENFYLDDGAYLAVKIIIAFCKARESGGLNGMPLCLSALTSLRIAQPFTFKRGVYGSPKSCTSVQCSGTYA